MYKVLLNVFGERSHTSQHRGKQRRLGRRVCIPTVQIGTGSLARSAVEAECLM
jgi:hypothetical protein